MKRFIKKWLLPPGITSVFNRIVLSFNIISDAEPSSDLSCFLAKNKQLKNRHTGERCFILGAGPSIKNQDFNKLIGEYVISVSNTFVHKDYYLFKPKYHVCPSIKGHKMHSMETRVKWLKEMEQKTMNAEMIFHVGDRKLIVEHGLFQARTIYWNEYCEWDGSMNTPIDISKVPVIWSVSELVITVALFLGFEKIYLLGFDHDWFNGVYNYFYERSDHTMGLDQSKVAFADSEFQMRRHAEIFKKYKYLYGIKNNIFNTNANPDTYVDVFPLVCYESLF